MQHRDFVHPPSKVFETGKCTKLTDSVYCGRTSWVMRPKDNKCARFGTYIYFTIMCEGTVLDQQLQEFESKLPTDDESFDVSVIAEATGSTAVRLPRSARFCGLVSVLRSDWETPYFVPLERQPGTFDESDATIADLLHQRYLLILIHEPEIYPDGHFLVLRRDPEPGDGWCCFDSLRQSGKPFNLSKAHITLLLNASTYAIHPAGPT